MLKQISVQKRIDSIYYSLSKTEQKIADFVLQSPNYVARNSISALSEKISISEAKIFQFSKKLGFKGFKDFKIGLLTDEFDSDISIHENIKSGDPISSIIQKVFDSSIKSLKDTLSLIDEQKMMEAVTILLNAHTVKVFGLGGSNCIAHDTYHKFLRSPITVNYTSDSLMQLMESTLLTKNDVAIIFSHTGRTKDIINMAKNIKNNDAKIIAITSSPSSKLAQLSDVCLVSVSEEISYRSEALASRISQLAIVDSLFVQIMFSDTKKANKTLRQIRLAIKDTREN